MDGLTRSIRRWPLRAALALAALAVVPACASAPRIGVSTGVSPAEYSALGLIAKVKTALLNDPVVGVRRIDVQVTDLDVTLIGRVASEAERDRAVAIAGGVEGVRSVTSQLTIQP